MKFKLFLWLLFTCLVPACLVGQNITVIGIGRLGLCLALVFEKAGYQVLGVDLNSSYIDQINNKTFVSPEPLVTEYLKASQNFRATTSLEEGLEFSDLCFIAVPTNFERSVYNYNFDILSNLLARISSSHIANKHLVISSTISPGYIRDVARPLFDSCEHVTLSYNPEFIAQGDIIRGLESPDIVLIGEDSKEAGEMLESIYRTICSNEPYISRMSPDSAEIAKLALNCFVTAKIAFANLVGDIADRTPGADKDTILQCIGTDQRIGTKSFKAGYGFGGPCFPRDNRALADYADTIGIEPVIFRSTDKANEMHAEILARKYLEMNLPEYLFEDVCYKSRCPVPIIEASQKLAVAKKIAEEGRPVFIKDRPEVVQLVEAEYGVLFQYIEDGL